MSTGQEVDAAVQRNWDEVRAGDGYWVEGAKVDFGIEIRQLFDDAGISRADLARRIGKTPAYITKIFRGDVNFTIESMVKLCRALGGRLELRARREAENYQLVNAPVSVQMIAPIVVAVAPPPAWLWSVESAPRPQNITLNMAANNDGPCQQAAA